MKIRAKVVWLLVVIAAVFAAFLILYGRSEVKWMSSLFKNRVVEQKRFFDELVDLKGASLKAHVVDYTFWDEMVTFVKNKDENWAVKNLTPSLEAFKDNALWVYAPDFSLVYSSNNISANDIKELPISANELAQLFAQKKLCHFFMMTSKGLMEIRGATIHPTRDFERKTPLQGYFFAGLLWDRNYINDFPRVLDGTIDLIPAQDPETKSRETLPFGTISFAKPLDGWDGKPLMYAYVTSKSVALRELFHSFRSQFVIFMFFSVGVTGILLFFLVRWVNIPLKRISDSLSEEDVRSIGDLMGEETEYGHIARLVNKFFEQKLNLENEIKERKEAEDKLTRLSADLQECTHDLEEKVRQRSLELQKAQEKVVRSEKLALVGQLASSVSHELRTPLTGIKNAAYLLRMHGVDKQNPKLGDTISLIDKEVEECTQVIGNMLGFMKPKDPVKKQARLGDILKESVSISIIPSNIRMTMHLQEDMLSLTVDPLQIRQVFDNMIKNAVEAMTSGGDLDITTYTQPDFAIVEFKDNGVGIPPENIGRIFDPLFSTFPKGAGLGLTVCQQIVEAHSGTIEVDSEVGRGTVFKVKLPVV